MAGTLSLLAICLIPALMSGSAPKVPAAKPAANTQVLSILKQAAKLLAQLPPPEKETDISRVRQFTDLGELLWRAGDPVNARKAFAEAFAQANRVKPAPDDLKGGPAPMQTVAEGHAHARDFAGLEPLLKLLTDYKDPEGYSGKPRHSEVLREVALAQANAGDMKAAKATLAKIEDKFTRRFATMDFMSILVKRGDVNAAQALLETFGEADLPYATASMATALADAGKLPEAIALTASLEVPAEGSGSDLFAPTNYKARAQGHIAKVQAKAGDLAGAQKTLAMMTDRLDKADALSALVLAQRKAGDAAGAQRSYAQCRAIRADVEKNHFDFGDIGSSGMNAVQLEARAGKWDEARRLALFRLNDGSVFGPFALDGLLYAYEEIGDYPGALAAANLAKDPGKYRYGIARSQATEGDVVGALTWASAEASPSVKASALIGAARGALDRADKAVHTP